MPSPRVCERLLDDLAARAAGGAEYQKIHDCLHLLGTAVEVRLSTVALHM